MNPMAEEAAYALRSAVCSLVDGCIAAIHGIPGQELKGILMTAGETDGPTRPADKGEPEIRPRDLQPGEKLVDATGPTTTSPRKVDVAVTPMDGEWWAKAQQYLVKVPDKRTEKQIKAARAKMVRAFGLPADVATAADQELVRSIITLSGRLPGEEVKLALATLLKVVSDRQKAARAAAKGKTAKGKSKRKAK